MLSTLFRARRGVIAVLMACLLSWCAPDAQAQGGPMGLIVRVIPAHAMDGFSDALALDNDQRDQLKVLHQGYRSARSKIVQEYKAMMEEVSEEMRNADFTKPEPMKQPLKKLAELNTSNNEKLAKVEAGFFNDVKGMLTSAQEDNWEKGQRWMRRFDASRFGVMAGSMADVSELAKEAGIERSGDVGALLDRYEVEVDTAIAGWRSSLDGLSGGMMVAISEDPMSAQEKIGKLIEDLFTSSHKVREVNRSTVRQLKDMAGEAKGPKFETTFLARSYPLVYGQRRIDNIMAHFVDTGDQFETLSADQCNEVKILSETHHRDMAIIRGNLSRGIDEEQDKILKNAKAMMMGPDIKPDSLFKTSLTARDQLEAKTLDRLKAIVGEPAIDAAKKGTKDDPSGDEAELVGDFGWLETDEPEPE